MEARTVLPQTSSEAILKPQTAGQILVAAKGLHWVNGEIDEVNVQGTGMKRIHLLIAVMIIVPCSSFSSPAFCQTSEYETVARNFLLFLKSDKQIVSTSMIQANDLDPTKPKLDIAFLANLSLGGYIIVSTSRHVSPVKAYSLSADFKTLPDAYKRYLFLENESRIRNLTLKSKRALTVSETEKSWDFLLQFAPSPVTLRDYSPDTYLLSTRWDQGEPYNKFLPELDGQKVVAGCSNITLAQLMKYHAHPSSGQGVSSYTWNGQGLEAVFYRPYHWENMPDAVSLAEDEYKADEVALLIRDLAIMNWTSFGLYGSSAIINFQPWAEHFGYSRHVSSMDNTDATLFFNTLRSEIDAMRPVVVSLPGHNCVADGYSSDPTGKKIHLNMGWGGHDDDYYYLDQTIVAGSFTYPPDITIFYNIKPCSGADCVTNLEPEDRIQGLGITGSFDFEMDADRYEVYLKGATTIGGSRGYTNQAFFISVYDYTHNFVASDSQPLQMNLAAGRYTVRISLGSESGFGYYEYDEYTDYSVQITTDPLSDAEKASIEAGLDIPPFIANTFKDRMLVSSDPSPVRLLIDARDENGDALTFNVLNSNPAAVHPTLEGNILVLHPVPGASNVASRIFVRALANGKTAEESFIVMVSNQAVGYGKSSEVTGLFENQSDYNTHKVILEGSCTITGFNGYSNQAFFSSVLDENGHVVCSPRDQPISRTFTRGVYFLGVSMQENPGGYGAYYPYEPGVNDQYVLSVFCPQADEQTATIAALLGIDLRGTEYPPEVPGDLDNDELVLNFGPAYGLFHYDQAGGWKQWNTVSPSQMVTVDLNGDGRDDIVAAFPGYGLYKKDLANDWQRINDVEPDKMIAADIDGDGKDELVAAFIGYGLYYYDDPGGWTPEPINTVIPDAMVRYSEGMVCDFGATHGLWSYSTSEGWMPLNAEDSDKIVAADIDGDGKDELVVSFVGWGLYIYEPMDKKWQRINTVIPDQIVAVDLDEDGNDELLISFTGYGLYVFEPEGLIWEQPPINTVIPENMIRLNNGVACDFGSAYGLWNWTLEGGWGGRWNSADPGQMVAADIDKDGVEELVVSFSGYGLYFLDETTGWQFLNAVIPMDMRPINFYP